jgi:hypothetical protein
LPTFKRSRVLIVARLTADSGELYEAVAGRASEGACSFTLLVPAAPRRLRLVGSQRDATYRDAERRLSAALPLLSAAAGDEVVGIVGSDDPLHAVQDALKLLGFDEVIVSMLAPRHSRWRRDGLPQKIRSLGVVVIEVAGSDSPVEPLPAA